MKNNENIYHKLFTIKTKNK